MKVLFLAVLFSLFGKESSENGITYRHLSWTDFRAPVPENETAAAMTATEMVMITTGSDDHYTFEVTSYFLPDSSFVRVKSESHLRHEQTHFSISFLMAKECMQKLRSLQHGPEINVRKADSIYTYYCDASNDLNVEFDRETGHGVNAAEEQRWEERISARLNKFVVQKSLSFGRN